MGGQFKKFGDIYKASVYGTSMYATRDVEFAHHVLVENWQNYVEGQGIKRVALLDTGESQTPKSHFSEC